ncbi:tetratricopeptide repeat protein [Vannielia sp.]|uniref:tetratricopeptide repeat protein n=1 Tax=Vannielia sp. TaxID=2813045 RepID=UPI00262300A6|nr:tetratricopeptide repeat protein [Vannielia sp.]MDF1872610.1 tetratricopeptide repeat protein [Vannielia sp.]
MRHAALALALTTAPLAAQSADEIEAARQAFHEGHHALALTVLIPAAEAGDAVAQNTYAIALGDGLGVPVDGTAAVEMFEKSMAQGNLKAMHNLAHHYHYGAKGVPADPAKALTLYEEAIAKGYKAAGAGLGRLYANGLGVEADPARAAELYAMGAEAQEPNAAYNLANAYRTGTGVAEDPAKALALYTEAGLLGNGLAWNALGLMFEYGMGTEANNEAAFLAYREAINADVALAGINAGLFVTAKEGPWQDPVEGYGYCLWGINNAAEDDRETFIQQCEALVEYLSVEEEDAAKRFAEGL